jgi:hypothetical protein
MVGFFNTGKILTYINSARAAIDLGVLGTSASVLRPNSTDVNNSIETISRRSAYISVATTEVLIAALSLAVIVTELFIIGRCCQKARHSYYGSSSASEARRAGELQIAPNV